MNLSRVRASSFAAFVAALVAAFVMQVAPAPAQVAGTNLWFQGTRLILEHPVPMGGELAVPTRDAGMRRFLERLGATIAYQPRQRYVVVTSEDRRTIAFTIGDPAYTAGGIRARAAFAPFLDQQGDPVLPFYALARALYVEPIPDGFETVLQPRVGALDVRTEGGRTVVTVRAAMPLVPTTLADAPDRLQLSFAGLGSSLAPERRAGPGVSAIDVASGGSAKVPTTTLTIVGARGATHRVVATGSPATYQIVFEGGAAAGVSGAPSAPGAPPTPPPLVAGVTPAPYGPPTASPPVVAGRATVTNLTIEPGADDALAVRVALSGAVAYSWHRLPDGRWYVDLAQTTLSGPGRNERPGFGSVQSVRVAQIGSTDMPSVRIAFSLAGDPRIDLTPSADGLLITVGTAASTDLARSGAGRTGGAPLVASAVPPPAAAAPAPAPEGTPWKYTPGAGSRTIVIDPGHGGGDTGAMHNGLVEKNLTWDIAQRLRALLVAQGWTVRMTRDGDIDPVSSDNLAKMRGDGKPNASDRAYLQTRCDVANDLNARLFISIHINSAPVTSARGTTVYWYKPQDAPFAQAIEHALVPAAGTQDDGTRHENFYVVRHTTMPAVLIETAFLTNPGDVALLRSPDFLQNVAQGIADGVRAYTARQTPGQVSER